MVTPAALSRPITSKRKRISVWLSAEASARQESTHADSPGQWLWQFQPVAVRPREPLDGALGVDVQMQPLQEARASLIYAPLVEQVVGVCNSRPR